MCHDSCRLEMGRHQGFQVVGSIRGKACLQIVCNSVCSSSTQACLMRLSDLQAGVNLEAIDGPYPAPGAAIRQHPLSQARRKSHSRLYLIVHWPSPCFLPETMIRAYNDAQGVTERFNKNILARINRELGGQFNPDDFRYFSTWNVFHNAIQSFLISSRDQSVYIASLDQSFEFQAWEAIYTEASHKFTQEQIFDLAKNNGFEVEARYFDDQRYFVDCLWRAV